MSGSTQNTEDILSSLGANYDEDDIKIVQKVCEVLSARAAALASVCKSIPGTAAVQPLARRGAENPHNAAVVWVVYLGRSLTLALFFRFGVTSG